jgi:hypothetical protein
MYNMETQKEIETNPPLQPSLSSIDNSNADIFGVVINDPRVDRSMYDSRGKYFDTFKFNAEFNKYIDEQSKERLLNNELKTHDLNVIENTKSDIYNTPISQILINTQNFWFKIFDNIKNGNNIFKDCDYNDFLYTGITFIVVVLIYIVLFFIFY